MVRLPRLECVGVDSPPAPWALRVFGDARFLGLDSVQRHIRGCLQSIGMQWYFLNWSL